MQPSKRDRPVEVVWCIGEVSPLVGSLTASDFSWLSVAEQDLVRGMRFPKRRSEWLSGRWAAKHLLLRYLPHLTNKRMSDISIENHPDGYPLVWVDGEPLKGCLSISHRQNKAAAAYTTERDVFLGIDLEWIEERHPAFLQDYFTDHEIKWVQAATPDERAARTTLLWSAKEAALKALQLGLAVDTRMIEVHPRLEGDSLNWQILEYCGDLSKEGYHLMGWWQQRGDYMVTLTVQLPATEPLTFDLREISLSD
ncbi:MAG: 4'-phosphopantetheinyl transferase superfamily protein [Bellilinea sp.]|nr:4'-phosphopantetheinyl transferase superfamily protein [Bellilinea sp.]